MFIDLVAYFAILNFRKKFLLLSRCGIFLDLQMPVQAYKTSLQTTKVKHKASPKFENE